MGSALMASVAEHVKVRDGEHLNGWNATQRAALVYIAHAANADTGECWTSMQTLAKDNGFSVKTFERAARRAIDDGLCTAAWGGYYQEPIRVLTFPDPKTITLGSDSQPRPAPDSQSGPGLDRTELRTELRTEHRTHSPASPLSPLSPLSPTARSTHASVTPTARDHDLDVPDDWRRDEPYWSDGWRRDLSILCRDLGLAGSNKAQLNRVCKEAIRWRMHDGYGVQAISDALRVAGRVDGRPRTIPWILHAEKIDRSIVNDIDEDWLEVDPFTT